MKKLLLLSLVLILLNSCCEAFFVLEQCDKAESIKDDELKKLLDAPTRITLDGKYNYLFSTFILSYECKCKCITMSLHFRKNNQLIPKKFWVVNTKTKKAWSKDISIMNVRKDYNDSYFDPISYWYYKTPLELVSNKEYENRSITQEELIPNIEVIAEVKDINNNNYLIKTSGATIATVRAEDSIVLGR